VVLPPSWAAAASHSAVKTGTIGIRLVPLTGESTNNPLSHSYIVDRSAPRTRLSRTVEIDNDTNSSVHLSVYVAGANVVHGNFTFAPGREANALSTWTSVSDGALRLAPHTEVFDTVTVRVPKDASSGEHYAVVWAALSASPSGRRGITLVSRVGVRMYVAVGPGGSAPSTFTLGALSATRSPSGELLLVAQVHNSSKNTLELSGHLMLSKGTDGLRAGPFPATLGTILSPGRSETLTVSLHSSFPRGPWSADVSVSDGSLSRSTIKTLTFPSRYSTPGEDLMIPLIFILGSLVVAALLVVMFVRRRLRLGSVPAPRNSRVEKYAR
jgi:hypothetical protein